VTGGGKSNQKKGRAGGETHKSGPYWEIHQKKRRRESFKKCGGVERKNKVRGGEDGSGKSKEKGKRPSKRMADAESGGR